MKKLVKNLILSGSLAASGLLMVQAAHADTEFCESPWLKKGTRLGGVFHNPQGKGTFKILVLSVNKKAPASCDVKLNLNIAAKGGQFPMTAKGDVSMAVLNDNALIRGTLQSQALLNNSIQAKLEINTDKHLLFKPMSKVPSNGGNLDSMYMRGGIQGSVAMADGKPAGQIGIEKAYAMASGRKLSGLQQIKTALGVKECQTVKYTAQFSSGSLTIPLLNLNKNFAGKPAEVTETYCPSLGLSPKIAFGSGKDAGILEINSISTPGR